MQQQYFSTATSQLSAGVLVNIGAFAVTDPVARALGASDLRPETSRHYSGGLVLTPREGLTFSLDAFRIEIEDHIALSESLTGPTRPWPPCCSASASPTPSTPGPRASRRPAIGAPG